MVTCRYCSRLIHQTGIFWEDSGGYIYCFVSRGQHEPAKPEKKKAAA